MELSALDRAVLARVAQGLALVGRPFAVLGRAAGTTESDAIRRLRHLKVNGAIKRMGLIVRHHELGYRANAMVAWDIDDVEVDTVGARMAALPFVTLCYRRRRAPPRWPYNLFAMIHGTDCAVVRAQIDRAITELGLRDQPHAVLFSRRRFKQRGARYDVATAAGATEDASWTRSIAAS